MDFGFAVIEQLLEKDLLKEIADIYYLKKEDIAGLKKNGDKFASNLINAINESKNNHLDKLISALGIRHVGTKGAKALAKEYKTIKKLMEADIENLSLVDDIGEITAKSIWEFFKQEQTKELIEKLKNAGVNMESDQEEENDNRFKGKTFVLTGTLEKYTRDEASSIIEKFGRKNISDQFQKRPHMFLQGKMQEAS